MPEAVRGNDQGAKEAFERYVVPEIDVLLRVATSLTRSPTEAEDLVQDTLLRAYRAILRFDGQYPRAWLLTIMRNAQRNRVRRRRPQLLNNPDIVLRRVPDRSWHEGSAEAIVVGQLFDAAVEEAYRGLSERFRRVVDLVDIDGLSYREAADVLGIPVGTIMSRLHRARRRIRQHLDTAGLPPRRK
ncbi:MAG: sigma-70 family RNA polymerase sigma factor [Actinomycetota bacterium]|nr:sigma-70 family RNA polymerase sigma factor [Actinomycetota bacterium]